MTNTFSLFHAMYLMKFQIEIVFKIFTFPFFVSNG